MFPSLHINFNILFVVNTSQMIDLMPTKIAILFQIYFIRFWLIASINMKNNYIYLCHYIKPIISNTQRRISLFTTCLGIKNNLLTHQKTKN